MSWQYAAQCFFLDQSLWGMAVVGWSCGCRKSGQSYWGLLRMSVRWVESGGWSVSVTVWLCSSSPAQCFPPEPVLTQDYRILVKRFSTDFDSWGKQRHFKSVRNMKLWQIVPEFCIYLFICLSVHPDKEPDPGFLFPISIFYIFNTDNNSGILMKTIRNIKETDIYECYAIWCRLKSGSSRFKCGFQSASADECTVLSALLVYLWFFHSIRVNNFLFYEHWALSVSRESRVTQTSSIWVICKFPHCGINKRLSYLILSYHGLIQ